MPVMRKSFILVLMLFLFGCSVNIEGQYKSIEDSSLIETISFDGKVATFTGDLGAFYPHAKYDVEDDKIHIYFSDGIIVFTVIDSNTLECDTFPVEGMRFKK
jgi:hypothetical protein